MLEPTGPADCETLAETVRVHGVAAAERRLSRRTLAFHGKDFGAAPRQGGLPDWAKRETARPAPKPQPRFVRPEPKPQPSKPQPKPGRGRTGRVPGEGPGRTGPACRTGRSGGPPRRCSPRSTPPSPPAGSTAPATCSPRRSGSWSRTPPPATPRPRDAARFAAHGDAGSWGEGGTPGDSAPEESGDSRRLFPQRVDGPELVFPPPAAPTATPAPGRSTATTLGTAAATRLPTPSPGCWTSCATPAAGR